MWGRAELQVDQPLPRRAALLRNELISQQITKFFWTKEATHRWRLLSDTEKYVCTLEHHTRGARQDIDHNDDGEEQYEYA